jgi:hypothetical protein
MAQGKKRQRRGMRKGKDWDDVLDTVLLTGRSELEVTAMTPSQRAAAKAQAAANSGSSERGERVRLWREWSDHPTRHGFDDWNEYLRSKTKEEKNHGNPYQ